VAVGVRVRVVVGVGVDVAVGVRVRVVVDVGVRVKVLVGVRVRVAVGVGVRVQVLVGVDVAEDMFKENAQPPQIPQGTPYDMAAKFSQRTGAYQVSQQAYCNVGLSR